MANLTSPKLYGSCVTSEELKELADIRAELNAQGRDVVDLSMLNPDLSPPRIMMDKLVEASLRPLNHRYAVSRGIRKLRDGFAEKYANGFGLSLDPEREICVTMGTKDALVHTLMALSIKGYRSVLLPSPTYPAYGYGVALNRLEALFYELSDNLSETLRSIEIGLGKSPKTILLLNFPNNPTGIVASREFYSDLAKIVNKFDAFVINDFVYGEMCFEGAHCPSLLCESNIRERAVETYSLSKAYSVPGWRVGALLGEASIVRSLSRLKSQLDYGVFLPLQMAAAAALSSKLDLVAETRAEYQERVMAFSKGLLALGWEVSPAAAGASVWAKSPQNLSEALAKREPAERDLLCLSKFLLRQAGIASMPGSMFGEEFTDFVRFALVKDLARLRLCLERLGGVQHSFIDSLKVVSGKPESEKEQKEQSKVGAKSGVAHV